MIPAAVLIAALCGLGAYLLVASLPYGAPRPSFAQQLGALRTPPPEPLQRPVVFEAPVLERYLRPVLQHAGDAAARVGERLGLSSKATAARLAAAGERQDLGLWWGQRLASALIGFAALPAATQLGGFPLTPPVVWAGLGIAGFVGPEMSLRAKAARAHRRMREQLVRLIDLLSLAVSAGLGLESAIEEVCATQQGRLYTELADTARRAARTGKPLAAALGELPERLGLPELRPIVAAVGATATRGTSIGPVMRAQARKLRDDWRFELITAGERAQVRMLIPVGLLILPAFVLLMLYAAGAQLLRAVGP